MATRRVCFIMVMKFNRFSIEKKERFFYDAMVFNLFAPGAPLCAA